MPSRRPNGLHAQWSQRHIRSPAFAELSFGAQATLLHLDLIYWESQRQNPIEVGQRWLAEEMKCDPKTAAKIINELDDGGFIARERVGSMRGPRKQRASVYRLTWHPTNDGERATLDFLVKCAPIPKRDAGKIGASTKQIMPLNAPQKGSECGTFSLVGPSAKEMIETLKAQRDSGASG